MDRELSLEILTEEHSYHILLISILILSGMVILFYQACSFQRDICTRSSEGGKENCLASQISRINLVNQWGDSYCS